MVHHNTILYILWGGTCVLMRKKGWGGILTHEADKN